MTTRSPAETHDLSDLGLPNPTGGTPGKRSMTQGLMPRPILFRVESADAARELGLAFGHRDGNGVAEHADLAVDRAASGSGEPLRADLRARFEGSLGADLSDVRIHRSADSALANDAVGARAYTVGRDIHFGAGQYQPDDPFGLHLLAHEVAHTRQQAGAAPTRQHKLAVSTPGDAAELEADRAADAMVSGAPASVSFAGGALARKSDAGPDGRVGEQPAPPPPGPAPVECHPSSWVEVADGTCAHPEPPPPMNWGGTPPAPSTPSAPWSGTPVWKQPYEKPQPKLADGKSAFGAAWTALQSSYNNLHKMHKSVSDGERSLPPTMFKVAADEKVIAEGAHGNATDAFKGDALKPELTKLDSGKVPPEVRKKIIDLRERGLPDAEADVATKGNNVAIQKAAAANAESALQIAQTSVEIVWTDDRISKEGLNKEQIKRDLEDYRAELKATVDTFKAMTGTLAIFTETDPTKRVQALLKAAEAGATAGASSIEANQISTTNAKLKAVDGKLAKLGTQSANLKATNAGTVVDQARRTVSMEKAKIENAMRDYETAVRKRDAVYNELATQMALAAKGSGMKEADQTKLEAAVEAIPKIKKIIDLIKGMKGNLPVPAYTEAGGVGAAMATNAEKFVTNLGTVKGATTELGKLETLWTGRLASVEGSMKSATAMKGT